MSHDPGAMSVQKLYGEIWANADAGFDQALEASLQPRGFDLMDERFASFGIEPEHLVLDVGSRDARYALLIAKQHGCRVIATDPVPIHMELSRKALAEAEPEVTARVELSDAPIEAMPFEDGIFDFIWCRDMLNHVGLRRGMAEMARVLKPGGRIIVFQTFETPSLAPNEARRLYEIMSIFSENMDTDFFRECVTASGLNITNEIEIGSEWREWQLEAGTFDGNGHLLQLSRMRRNEDELVAQFGRARYEATLGDIHWQLYLLLGKLSSWIFELQKPAA